MHRGWLWFVVPLVAIAELLAARYFSRRTPTIEEWRAIAQPVARIRQPEDALVVSPTWAEPLARHTLGDRLWPLADVARPGFEGARRAIEISILGQHAAWLSGWPIVSELDQGAFHLSVHENPNYSAPLTNLLERVQRGDVAVFRMHEGTRYECHYKRNVQPSTGGLHGHVAFPRERFICGDSDVEFVGATVIDDEHYRARRCIWAHPVREGTLWLRFESVPLGATLRGHVGLSYFLMRGGKGTDVVMDVFVDGKQVGEVVHKDQLGWQPFRFSVTGGVGRSGRLEFKIHSQRFEARHFCFFAETA